MTTCSHRYIHVLMREKSHFQNTHISCNCARNILLSNLGNPVRSLYAKLIKMEIYITDPWVSFFTILNENYSPGWLQSLNHNFMAVSNVHDAKRTWIWFTPCTKALNYNWSCVSACIFQVMKLLSLLSTWAMAWRVLVFNFIS